jgi:hypothetical protein
MNVIGFKANANFDSATLVLKKHTNHSISDIKTILDMIKDGKAVVLPDDFVLREDLEELNFLID